MEITSWGQFISSVGLPGAMILGLGYMAWRAGCWLGVNAIKPIVDSHLDYLETTKSVQKLQAKCLENQAACLENQTNALANQTQLIREIRDSHGSVCKFHVIVPGSREG